MTGLPISNQSDDSGEHRGRDRASSGQPFDINHTPFEALGGETKVRELVDRFYDHMDQDPEFAQIRGLHTDDLTLSREKLFEFFCGWLGGPQLYVQKYGHPRLRARHGHVSIGIADRDQWLACMDKAMDDCQITGELRAFLVQRLSHTADFMRNREG